MRITDGTPYWTEVRKLIVEYAEAQGLDFTFQNLEAELENLTARYGGRKGRLLVALDDGGTALGCIACQRHNGLRCEMKRFYVRPQARGRKVGSALLQALVELAARDGYDEMVLDTAGQMESAIALCRANGFEPIGPYGHHPRAGDHYMRRNLCPGKTVPLGIRAAGPEDYEAVRDFYYRLTEEMEHTRFAPGWKKDVYPTQAFLKESLQKGELYAGWWNGTIPNYGASRPVPEAAAPPLRMVAAMVVNHRYNEGYRGVRWAVDVPDGELGVIHALGVLPAFSGRHAAAHMAPYALDLARTRRLKVLRLDLLKGNLPAERAYLKVGFTYVDTVRQFYEDTGWTEFKLFECVL